VELRLPRGAGQDLRLQAALQKQRGHPAPHFADALGKLLLQALECSLTNVRLIKERVHFKRKVADVTLLGLSAGMTILR
jgi:hypothetical protein